MAKNIQKTGNFEPYTLKVDFTNREKEHVSLKNDNKLGIYLYYTRFEILQLKAYLLMVYSCGDVNGRRMLLLNYTTLLQSLQYLHHCR